MLRQLVALTTVAAAGCGGRAWSTAGPSVAEPAFARGARGIVTVDVLPLDLAVWTEAGVTANPAELRARVEPRIINTALADIAVDLSWMAEGDGDLDLGAMWRAQPPSPDLDKHSQLYLEMTLVDNRTGLVLWHTHQVFPANAAKPGDPERAARVLLSSLPAR